MEVEQLKLLAERLGYYKVEPVGDALGVIGIFVTKEKFGMAYKFNPEYNAEQREEILIELIKNDWILEKDNTGDFMFIKNYSMQRVYDKDYTQALLKAAIEIEGK